MSNPYIPDQLHHMSRKELLEFSQTAHEENVRLVQQLVKANERIVELESYNLKLANESHEYQKRCAELEKNQVPIENGKNRYGLDVSYFRNVINRELNRPLANHKPDELARVLVRLSRTADEPVMFEPEFSSKFAIEQKIEILQELADEDENGTRHVYYRCLNKIEQLRKDKSNG